MNEYFRNGSKRAILGALLVSFSLAAQEAPRTKQPGAATPEAKAEIEQIVQQYILDHGDLLMQAVTLHQQKQREAQQQRAKEAVQTRKNDLVGDPSSPVIEAAAGKSGNALTIVEFFDYRCGYCKRVAPTVKKMLEDNPGVRLVFKEFPILGPDSVTAAKAALAASRQGAYVKFHDVLLASSEPVTQAAVEKVASELGLDVPKFRADMESPEILQALERNRDLATALGVQGTPGFVVGSEVVAQAMDAATFQALITKVQGQSKEDKAGVKAGL